MAAQRERGALITIFAELFNKRFYRRKPALRVAPTIKLRSELYSVHKLSGRAYGSVDCVDHDAPVPLCCDFGCFGCPDIASSRGDALWAGFRQALCQDLLWVRLAWYFDLEDAVSCLSQAEVCMLASCCRMSLGTEPWRADQGRTLC